MNNSKMTGKALTSMLYIYPFAVGYIPFGVGYCLLSELWVFGDTSERMIAIVPTLLFI